VNIMASLIDAFSQKKEDSAFFGRDNCFRAALEDPETSETGALAGEFSGATKGDIEELLEFRKGSEWNRQRINTDEKEARFQAAIRGLCYATAGIKQRSPELIHEAVKAFAGLGLVDENMSLPAADPAHREIEGIQQPGSAAQNDIDELLQDFTGSESPKEVAAALMIRDLAVRPVGDIDAVCACPVAYAWGSQDASILRLIVRCLPSDKPLITPDLWYGGALLWSVSSQSSQTEDTKVVPGWTAITKVWEKLHPLCPGVRVSIGIEEWDPHQELTTPILEGDSIQAATALAIWHAWHKTSRAAARRSEIEKIDIRLPDFELDPAAIVTASLDLTDFSPATWKLKWVNNVSAKFRAAGKCSLQLGVTARTKPPEAETECSSTLTHCDADTFPELCEIMSLSGAQLRDYRKRCSEEWDGEFLNDEEAEALIAERAREQAEQTT